MWKVYLDLKVYAASLANCRDALQRDQVYLVQVWYKIHEIWIFIVTPSQVLEILPNLTYIGSFMTENIVMQAEAAFAEKDYLRAASFYAKVGALSIHNPLTLWLFIDIITKVDEQFTKKPSLAWKQDRCRCGYLILCLRLFYCDYYFYLKFRSCFLWSCYWSSCFTWAVVEISNYSIWHIYMYSTQRLARFMRFTSWRLNLWSVNHLQGADMIVHGPCLLHEKHLI